MMIAFRRPGRSPMMAAKGRWALAPLFTRCGGHFRPPCVAESRSTEMKWETPQAVDFRFGMEITMYIANR